MSNQKLIVTGLVFGLGIVLLTACESAVQTTSGRAYLEKYPETRAAQPPPARAGKETVSPRPETIETKVRRVAAVEPTLRFPARIGLARIYRGQLSPVPAEEAAAWMKGMEKLGPDFGQFIPLNRLVAEMVTYGSARDRYRQHDASSRLHQTMEKIRLGAARQHMDAVLVYEVYGESGYDSNLISALDFTIIGAFFLPGENVRAEGFASALLVDVRNGYPYGTARKVVKRATVTPSYGSREESRRMQAKAETRAAVALVPEVDKMLRKLRDELARKVTAEAGRK